MSATPYGPLIDPIQPVMAPVPNIDPHLYYATETIRKIQEQYDRLKYQLSQKNLRESSLVQAYRLQGNTYWAQLPSGVVREFTDFVFEYVRLYCFDPYTNQEALIELKVSHHDAFQLTVDDFLNDRKFLNHLQLAGCKITMYGPVSKIATLLRSIATQLMTRVCVPFFAGWCTRGGSWEFLAFKNLGTCARTALPVHACTKLPHVLPAAAKIAVERFTENFNAITYLPLRLAILLWQHIAFLSTILAAMGCHVHHALFLELPSARVESHLKNMLCEAANPVISLDMSSTAFLREIAFHKDQPLIIYEGTVNGAVIKNSSALCLAIRRGELDLCNKDDIPVSIPLRTAPIILGKEGSYLAWQPEVISLKLENLDFSVKNLGKSSPQMEYWAAFADFAMDSTSVLQSLLEESISIAFDIADQYEFSAETAELISILIALHRFIEIFYKRLNCPPLANQSDWLDGLVEILDINSAQATGEDGLAEIFIEVGRNMLRNKRFSLSPMGQCTTATDSQGTVYFDRNYFAFDKAAFDRICNEAGCPPSATKQKLKEKGILSGKTVNAQSYLTRIACYNAYGRVQSIRVYKFKREVFERLGEPPLI